jgi:RNA polymerase sigma factor (sigma-70 family)
MHRVRRVIEEELTELQRQTLIAYYFQEQTIPQIAAERGVNKSTVSRTLRRAEEKLRRYLKY